MVRPIRSVGELEVGIATKGVAASRAKSHANATHAEGVSAFDSSLGHAMRRAPDAGTSPAGPLPRLHESAPGSSPETEGGHTERHQGSPDVGGAAVLPGFHLEGASATAATRRRLNGEPSPQKPATVDQPQAWTTMGERRRHNAPPSASDVGAERQRAANEVERGPEARRTSPKHPAKHRHRADEPRPDMAGVPLADQQVRRAIEPARQRSSEAAPIQGLSTRTVVDRARSALEAHATSLRAERDDTPTRECVTGRSPDRESANSANSRVPAADSAPTRHGEQVAPPTPVASQLPNEMPATGPVESPTIARPADGLQRVADDACLLLATHSARIVVDVGVADPLTLVVRMRGGLADVRALGPAAETIATGEASLRRSLGEQGLNLGSFSAHDDRRSWAGDGGRDELDDHRDLFAGRHVKRSQEPPDPQPRGRRA